MFNILKMVLREPHEEGKDLPSGEEENPETQDSDAQKIIDEHNGKDPEVVEEIKLPSDEKPADEDKLFAEKYKTVDDLKKGIAGLKSDLPDYVVDGMSDDALEQHYVELRKNFSGKDDKSERKFQEDEKPKEEDEKPDDKKEEKKTEVAGLWKSLENDFKATGKITSDMYDKFEEMGIPSDIVDGYADKVRGEQVDFTNKVYEMSGGEDKFLEIKAWAEDGNIHASELKAMESMPYDAIISAMSGVKARYDIANAKKEVETPEDPKRIIGDTRKSSNGSYTSQEAYMNDVADRRYGQNRAYTELVDKKFKASKFK